MSVKIIKVGSEYVLFDVTYTPTYIYGHLEMNTSFFRVGKMKEMCGLDLNVIYDDLIYPDNFVEIDRTSIFVPDNLTYDSVYYGIDFNKLSEPAKLLFTDYIRLVKLNEFFN